MINSKIDSAQAMSVKQAAETLAIGKTTIYKLLKEGRLRSYKIGRRRLILAESVSTYVQECCAENVQTWLAGKHPNPRT